MKTDKLTVIETALFAVGLGIYWTAPPTWKNAGMAFMIAGVLVWAVTMWRNLQNLKRLKREAADARRQVEEIEAENRRKGI